MVVASEITLSTFSERKESSGVAIGSTKTRAASRQQGATGFYLGFKLEPKGDLLHLLTQGSAFVASSGSSSPVILEVGYTKPGRDHTPLVVPRVILRNVPNVREIKIHETFDAQALVDILGATEGDTLCPRMESLYAGHADMESFVKRRGGTVSAGIWGR